MTKKFQVVGKPPIFGQLLAEAVPRMDRARNLHGIAQAVNDFRCKFQLGEDLIPNRQKAHGAWVFEAERSVFHPLLKVCRNLAPNARDPRFCPPRDWKAKVVPY